MLRRAILAACAALLGCGRGEPARQIVFGTLTSGSGAPGPDNVYEVAIMNLDGSERRQLTSDGTQKFLPHFSPDGTKIAYTKFTVGGYGAPDAQHVVALYDLETERETVLTGGGEEFQPTWSPDGKRIAYLGAAGVAEGAVQATALWVMNSDGSDARSVASAADTATDLFWADIAWSSTDWILFVVAQSIDGCFKARTDKIRPDGSARTQVTAGGPDCTPGAGPQSGDADPGWSADGETIYSSRGLGPPPGAPAGSGVIRHLYAFSSDAWYSGKPEQDLYGATSLCGANTPKGSPDGERVLLDRGCPDDDPKGIYVADTTTASWTYVGEGYGPDWNPRAP